MIYLFWYNLSIHLPLL